MSGRAARTRWGLGLGALALLAACPPPAPAAPDAGTRECQTRADCAPGRLCSPGGACEACASDGQCSLREVCDPAARLCALRPGWGVDCARNGDCAAGSLCVQGLCVPEKDAVLCAAGRCLADGQRCHRANGVCEQDIGCLADADCSDLELCNVPTNTCVLRCTAQTQGQICAAGQQCLDSRCADCADSSQCPGGMVCDRGRLACVVDGSARCLSNRDCAAGLTCNRATGFCTPTPPPCLSNDDCFKDERCDVPSGQCVKRACQADRFEPNGTEAEAKPIASGDYPGLTLCDGEEDWFAVKLSRGDRLDVFVDADPLLEDFMDARLFDPAGRVVGQGALALDTTVSADGSYRLRLRATDAFVEYGLRLAVSRGVPCDADRFEPSDSTAAATSVYASSILDKLTLCGLDEDWFRLEVPAGKGLRAELSYVPTEGAADLLVLAADGATELARNAGTAPLETVRVGAAALAGQAAFLRVVSLDARARAEYSLGISFE